MFSPLGDSHDGVCDMSGNVYEWTCNWMEYFKPEWEDMTLVDPLGRMTVAIRSSRADRRSVVSGPAVSAIKQMFP